MFVDLPIDDAEREAIAKSLYAHIDARSTDLAPSTMPIDPALYRDPAMADRERREVFAHVPVIAAHGSEIPLADDFVRVQLARNEAVIVRQRDGGVRSFVNACRHRGARLVTQDQGNRKLHTCGYHGWSFQPDGALRSVALADTFGDVDAACLGLVELPTEERHGCVWVVDRPGAPIDVAGFLGPMDDVLGSYGLDRYVCYRTGFFDEAVNWKLLADAFWDGYHIAATHAGSVAPHFYNNLTVFRTLGQHIMNVTARRSIDRFRAGERPGDVVDRHITMAHFVMPNASFLRQPDHFEQLSFMPHPTDPLRCRMAMRVLIPQAATTDEERRRWDRNWDIMIAVLRDEDLVMNRDLQVALGSADVAPFVLGRNEVGNQHFHRWLQRALGGAETH